MSELTELPVTEHRIKAHFKVCTSNSCSGEVFTVEIVLQNIQNKYSLARYFEKCVMQVKRVTQIKSLPLRENEYREGHAESQMGSVETADE